jgi:hypothetical protein
MKQGMAECLDIIRSKFVFIPEQKKINLYDYDEKYFGLFKTYSQFMINEFRFKFYINFEIGSKGQGKYTIGFKNGKTNQQSRIEVIHVKREIIMYMYKELKWMFERSFNKAFIDFDMIKYE